MYLSVKVLASMEVLEVEESELFKLWRCLHPVSRGQSSSEYGRIEWKCAKNCEAL